jgi:hypothetical protein
MLLAYYKIDHNIGFCEKPHFFSRKMTKIVEISVHNIDPPLKGK